MDFTVYVLFLMLTWPLQPDENTPNTKLVQVNNIVDKKTCIYIGKQLKSVYIKDGAVGFHVECIPIRKVM
mgnify:CR=1 FL=1